MANRAYFFFIFDLFESDDEYFFLKIMDASRKDIHWME